MEGIERLEAEVLEMNNSNITAIFEYLKTRNNMTEYFNNEEKSIKQMYEFIYNKASKQKINNVAMISDRMVYLWAVTYFCKSNEELGLKNNPKPTPHSNEDEVEKTNKKSTEESEKKAEENNNSQLTLFQEVHS